MSYPGAYGQMVAFPPAEMLVCGVVRTQEGEFTR